LKEAAEWLDEYRKFWDESFERLDEYLAMVQTNGIHGVSNTKELK
jgi:hypothetical protein